MPQPQKYKLVRPGWGRDAFSKWGENDLPVYRVKALRDIPEHRVRKGDLGGYVTSKFTLSQEGSCWINGIAAALGNVIVTGDAYIGDDAFVSCDLDRFFIEVSGDAIIYGKAKIQVDNKPEHGSPSNCAISGNVSISGNARIFNTGEIVGAVGKRIRISHHALVAGASKISGHAEISENATIHAGAVIEGDVIITNKATILEDAHVTDCKVYGNSIIEKSQKVNGETFGEPFKTEKELLRSFLDDMHDRVRATAKVATPAIPAIPAVPAIPAIPAIPSFTLGWDAPKESPKTIKVEASSEEAETADAVLLLAEINEKFKAYETDIVKVIKYPVMTDSSYEPIALFRHALNRANRMAVNPAHTGFVEAVNKAEMSFLAAESYALKTASTLLTDGEKKKVSKVSDLLAVASNEASTEQEKKAAFTQAFKHLEGIIVVPDVAIDTFKVKIGLKELEA